MNLAQRLWSNEIEFGAQRLWSEGVQAHGLTIGKLVTQMRRGDLELVGYTLGDIELLLRDRVLSLGDEVDLEYVRQG